MQRIIAGFRHQRGLVAVLASTCALAGSALASAQTLPAPPGVVRSLDVTYSDGRTTQDVLRSRGGGWTPRFPRRPDAPAHRGLKLSALKLIYEVQGDVVVVSVALLYGEPHQEELHVATVRVAEGAPVTIGELDAFGVAPVRVAIGAVALTVYPIPSVTSASPLLDIDVDVPGPERPTYRLTVRNNANRAVRAYVYKMYAGEREVASGRQKTIVQTPVLEPGGEQTFGMAPGALATAVDRVEITGVLWEDGEVEGDVDLAASEQALAHGQARQLELVRTLLRDAVSEDAPRRFASAADLLEAVGALGIEPTPAELAVIRERLQPLQALAPDQIDQSVRHGRQQVKNVVMSEIDDAMAGGAAGDALRSWMTAAIARYERWLARLGVLR